MSHPVVEKIDQTNPYFTRKLIRRRSSGDEECELQIWLPVQTDDGVWVSAIQITNLNKPSISGMPGVDPLDAFLRAVTFARSLVDYYDGRFLFTDAHREGGGLLISLDYGLPFNEIAEVEAQAQALAQDAAKRFHDRMEADRPDRQPSGTSERPRP